MPDTKSDLADSIAICKVVPADLDELLYISRQTYFESFFEAFDDPDGFNSCIAEIFARDRISAEIADPDTVFYFAVYNDSVIGYMKLNFNGAQTIFQGFDAAEIERIYVLASHQNKHIGKALLDHAITTMCDKGLKWVWLGVWENNASAVRFYERHAFFRFDMHYYMVGNDRQTDFLMRKLL